MSPRTCRRQMSLKNKLVLLLGSFEGVPCEWGNLNVYFSLLSDEFSDEQIDRHTRKKNISIFYPLAGRCDAYNLRINI